MAKVSSGEVYDAIKFVTNNIGVISTLGTVISTVPIIFFLHAYLNIFDVNLMALIGYADLIQLIIMGIIVIVFIVLLAFPLGLFVYEWRARLGLF